MSILIFEAHDISMTIRLGWGGLSGNEINAFFVRLVQLIVAILVVQVYILGTTIWG